MDFHVYLIMPLAATASQGSTTCTVNTCKYCWVLVTSSVRKAYLQPGDLCIFFASLKCLTKAKTHTHNTEVIVNILIFQIKYQYRRGTGYLWPWKAVWKCQKKLKIFYKRNVHTNRISVF